MHELTRGQKARLAALGIGDALDVQVQVASPATFDFCAIGLDADERLSDDRYFVFFNQPRSPCGGVELLSPADGETGRLRLRLDRIPTRIDRLVIALVIDGRETMRHVKASEVRLGSSGVPCARFQFRGTDFSTERAVMLLEVYRRDGWRLAAVGQGFDGGIQKVLEHYGGVAQDEPDALAEPGTSTPEESPGRVTRDTVPTVVSARPGPVPSAPPEPLRLEGAGDRRSLRLARPELGLPGASRLRFELLWDQPSAPGHAATFGLGRSQAGAVVLELGFLVEGVDGRSFCAQGPGFPAPASGPPFVGAAPSDGERQSGRQVAVASCLDRLRRMLVYALIYEGTAGFGDVAAQLSIRDDTGSHLLLPGRQANQRGLWAIALIERSDGGIDVTRPELFFPGQELCDAYFGFGIPWEPSGLGAGGRVRYGAVPVTSPGPPG